VPIDRGTEIGFGGVEEFYKTVERIENADVEDERNVYVGIVDTECSYGKRYWKVLFSWL